MIKTTLYDYIRIEKMPLAKGRKTHDYHILNLSSGDLIGVVKWYGAWHQYCFWPEGNTVWNSGCLENVQDFLGKLKAERK